MPFRPAAFEPTAREAMVSRIAAALCARYGQRLRAVALEGSTAKGLAKPQSDLEFRVLLADGIDRWHTLFLDGMFVGLSYESEDGALREAGEIDDLWPVAGDRLFACRILYDPRDIYGRLRRQNAAALERADFAALAREALSDMHEHVLKLCTLENDALAVAYDAREVAFWAAMAVALAHRHRFASSRTLFEESTRLADLPAAYARHLRGLLALRTTPPRVRAHAADLWWSFGAWAAERGIVWGDPGLKTL